MFIPNNIFQCHKSFLYIKSNYQLTKAVTSWLVHTNSFNYYFYSDSMCDSFMKNNTSSRIYEAGQILSDEERSPCYAGAPSVI